MNDATCLVGGLRSDLNVHAIHTGSIAGRLQIKINGQWLSCCNRQGVSIPLDSDIDNIEKFDTDAYLILYIEKDTIFREIAGDDFFSTYPSILITGRGQPDAATKRLLPKLALKTKLPVFLLIDSDNGAFQVASTVMHGSFNMAWYYRILVTPRVKLVGLRPSDRECWQIDKKFRRQIKVDDRDPGADSDSMPEKTAKSAMVKKDRYYDSNRAAWADEIGIMLEDGFQVWLDVLLPGLCQSYLSKHYLPRKFRAHDWLDQGMGSQGAVERDEGAVERDDQTLNNKRSVIMQPTFEERDENKKLKSAEQASLLSHVTQT